MCVCVYYMIYIYIMVTLHLINHCLFNPKGDDLVLKWDPMKQNISGLKNYPVH